MEGHRKTTYPPRRENDMQKKNYRKTAVACYLGFVTQSIAANFAPLLYLTFQKSYGIPLTQIALISTTFFFTQLVTDLICAKVVEKIGYRPCVVASEVASVLGLVGLAFLPGIMPSPFAGVLISVIIYAVGSGLIEVLVSPIIEACPFEHKEAVMSMTHSFYCWGCVAVIVLSTLFFRIFGIKYWPILACAWALIPLVNTFLFAVCPIEHTVEEGKGMTISALLHRPLFWLLVVLMVCAGASELGMAQWASAFTERALGVDKAVGDLLGPCMFAVLMGICRTFYGKFGHKINMTRFMAASGALCVVCYVLAGLSKSAVPGLIGCALCGFSVGIMWPGSISIASRSLPGGGTAMFALLALAGDLGGSTAPSIIGFVSERASGSLQSGILAGAIFPLLLMATLLILNRKKEREGK